MCATLRAGRSPAGGLRRGTFEAAPFEARAAIGDAPVVTPGRSHVRERLPGRRQHHVEVDDPGVLEQRVHPSGERGAELALAAAEARRAYMGLGLPDVHPVAPSEQVKMLCGWSANVGWRPRFGSRASRIAGTAAWVPSARRSRSGTRSSPCELGEVRVAARIDFPRAPVHERSRRELVQDQKMTLFRAFSTPRIAVLPRGKASLSTGEKKRKTPGRSTAPG